MEGEAEDMLGPVEGAMAGGGGGGLSRGECYALSIVLLFFFSLVMIGF